MLIMKTKQSSYSMKNASKAKDLVLNDSKNDLVNAMIRENYGNTIDHIAISCMSGDIRLDRKSHG